MARSMYIYTSAIGHLTLTYLQYPIQPSDQQKQCPLYTNFHFHIMSQQIIELIRVFLDLMTQLVSLLSISQMVR